LIKDLIKNIMKKILFILLVSIKPLFGQLCLTSAINYSTGTNPQTIMSADFNKDGKIDLVTPNYSTTYVSILLGNGLGGFGMPTNFNVGGSNPQYVTCADFNSDMNMDIAVANTGSNNIAILLGTGTGSFTEPINYAVGGAPEGITNNDFNNDGKKDIAVVNSFSGNVSILLGTGLGTFLSPTNFSTGSTPMSVISGDFNSDSNVDLAVANLWSNNISILLGNGTGNFSPTYTFPVGTGPYCIVSSDFNNDGKLDLATSNVNSGNVTVLLGAGTGSFTSITSIPVGASPQNITTSDLNGVGNGDGNIDIITNANSTDVAVLLGNGTGTFGSALLYTGGNAPAGVTCADYNNDGKTDIAANNYFSNDISIFLNCQTPVAISENKFNNFTRVFPNPSLSYFKIESKGNFQYEIMDYLGKLITSGEGFEHIILTTDTFSSGLYFLRITNEANITNYKLVIDR